MSDTKTFFLSISGRKHGIPSCTLPALPRGSGTLAALTFQRVTGFCWAKAHLLGVSQSPLAELKGQSIFHSIWWLPPRASPPPVGKSIRALIKPHVFWFSVKILIFSSPAKIQQSPVQSTNNLCGSVGLYDKKMIIFG